MSESFQIVFRWNELYTCVRTGANNTKERVDPQMMYTLYSRMVNSSIEEEEIKFSICSTELRDNPRYIQDYILLANFIVMAFVPFVILTVINTMLYRTITR